jgi:hypothetical protein
MLNDGGVATTTADQNKQEVCFCAWAEMQCDATLIHCISMMDNGRSHVAGSKITIPHVAQPAVLQLRGFWATPSKQCRTSTAKATALRKWYPILPALLYLPTARS